MKEPERKQQRKTKKPFEKSQGIARAYERSLRKVAREVGRIIEGYQAKNPLGISSVAPLQTTLAEYAKILRPWAELKGAELAESTNRQDMKAWATAAAELSAGMRATIRSADVGNTMRDIMARQVKYITSLPVDAGQRVHKLVIEGLSDSTRAEEIAKEIARSGEVTESHAMLIARTETSRAQTALTQARALSVGSESYIWHSVHDARVRMRHRELNGTAHKWAAPPVASDDDQPVVRANPGEIYNCRCWAEPILKDR